MKLGSGILKSTVQQLSDENFHFYNSLVLTDDLAFQRTHFQITTPNIPRIYNNNASTDDNDDLLLQHRSQLQNHELMKIAILIATNTCTKETSHAIIDSGASCCVTPYIEDFIHQPTPIQNTTLKGIGGGLTALGRVIVQLKIHQNDTDNIILVIDNVIYASNFPIRLISPQQLHRQSKAKGHENSCFTTEETTSTLYKLPPHRPLPINLATKVANELYFTMINHHAQQQHTILTSIHHNKNFYACMKLVHTQTCEKYNNKSKTVTSKHTDK
jgi:hypothetical protein